MIFIINKLIEPIFENLGLSKYSKVSYSDKADMQINSVFAISKEMNVTPEEIGNRIVKKIHELENFSEYFDKVEFVLPGFINIYLSNKFICNFIKEKKYLKETEKKETYFIDYGGPNIAKPLHIGHLRPAIIGESIKRILKYKGHKVISDVHLGDFGLPIGQVIYGIQEDKKPIEEVTIEYLNETYPKISKLCKENEEVHKSCKTITFDFQQGKYKELYDKIKEVSLDDIKDIYNYLGVDFDLWLGESDSKTNMEKVIKLLEDKSLLVLDDGARVVHVKTEDDNKEMPPCMIINSEGGSMYAITDLTAIYDRVNKYNPDYILYVTDPRQSLHFEQVFRVAQMSGIKGNAKLEHIPNGTINGSDGKPFKTRSGEALKLRPLFDEVKASFLSKREENKNMNEEDLNKIINAIIKFADLQNNREKNYNFDISKFSDVNGKTGPYVLYSALRIKKIIDANDIDGILSDTIYTNTDRKLRIKIMEFDKYLNKAAEERLPSYMAEYVYDLCNILNTFYEETNISKITDSEMKKDFILILKIAYNIIEDVLKLLIIEIPSVM